MAAKLERTNTPGIFRRHTADCDREGRCECPYVVVWRHRGRQHTETFRTFAEAREARGGRDAGDRRPTSRIRFEDYFSEWIESYAGRTSRGFSETTRPEYRRPIEQHAIPKWKGWRLTEVEPGDVRDLFGELRRDGKSTSAIKKLRAALSAMFATAVEDGVIRSNPVSGVRVPAASSDEFADEPAKALTRAELALVLAALPQSWQLFFELLAHTGLRISEAIGLTWAHLDLGERPRVKVREQVYRGKRRKLKSRSGRRDVPLSPGMAARLLRHRASNYRGEDRPVFASRVGTELIPGKVRSRVLNPAVESIGLGWVGLHSFRHTAASLWFERGANVKQVSQLLGHADPAFTLRTYVHLMDDGIGDPGFLDEAVRVNSGSTQRPQTAANGGPAQMAETAG
jgi:integrase